MWSLLSSHSHYLDVRQFFNEKKGIKTKKKSIKKVKMEKEKNGRVGADMLVGKHLPGTKNHFLETTRQVYIRFFGEKVYERFSSKQKHSLGSA